MKRFTIKHIAKLQKQGEKIVVLTSYTAPIAKIADKYADILLVGDSLGMVIYGMDSTLGVSLNMMINHGRAVVQASEKALVVVDLPFATYQKNKEQAFASAAKVIAKTGAAAVKIEGGEHMAETISFLTERGIAVMAHIGLTPQSFNQFGGYGARGVEAKIKKQIIADALAVEKAGAFAVVIEGVKEDVAQAIVKKIKIPTIGIGAARECDGQVLVAEDMLGMTDKTPKFVKKYAQLNQHIEQAMQNYSKEVKKSKFPSKEYIY